MNLLKDNVPKLVKKLAVPAMVGTLFQTLYNIVDTFFAGKISPEALSALSKSFPIYFIIIATSIGVTVAGTSLIGNSIGENDKNKTINYFTHIIFYGIIVSIVITYLGLSYSEKVFSLMGSTNEVTFLGLQYTDVIYSGSIIFILVVALNSLLHAEGDTKTYRNVLILSFFLNIILNPILIFGFLFIPAMGVKGIGVATIIAQSLSLIIILVKVLKNSKIKEITKDYLVPKIFYFKNIFFQSMPITVSICGYALAAAIIFTYVGQSGEYAVAGYGAGTRIEQVVLLPILGINTAIISIISQNYGAKNFNRIKETYFTAIKYAFIIMVISGTIVFLSASVITSIFSSDPEVIEYGKRYLKISVFVLPAYPVFFLSNGFFMALKKSENAMISNFFRNVLNPIVVFYIAKYISASFDTFFWIWVGINWFFSILYFLIVIYYFNNKLEKSGAVIHP
jgi:putative MATE family efflux protein